jgi:6-phosphogluconolactonase
MNRWYAFIAAILLMQAVAAQKNYLVVGTYTGGKSEGLYVFTFDSNNGDSREISHVKTSNPSFVAVSPDQKYVYAVHEDAAADGKGGEVSAFSFNKSEGQLKYINEQTTRGDHPCFVEIDKTGKWVFAGNYTGGSLSVLPVKKNGELGSPTTTIQHKGSSINKERQEKAHVHCTLLSADNRFLFVPDLGMDKVVIYNFNAATGKLTSARPPFFKAVNGSGPRHITFHPGNKFAYLVEELSGTVETFRYSNGILQHLQRISTMPAGDSSFAGSADIHVSPDGKFLYASNRGNSNTIAIFRIDTNTGLLTLVGHQSTLGQTPRNFNFDPTGNFLLVANQNSDEIVVFRRDKETGLLTDTGKRISVGKPVCLKWIAMD